MDYECQVCGQRVIAAQQEIHGSTTMIVVPCPYCVGKAYEEGFKNVMQEESIASNLMMAGQRLEVVND